MKQYGFFFDSTKCTGCKTCQVSCKDEKDLDLGPKFRRVYEFGGGSWQQQDGIWQQNIYNYYLSISCNHCSNPTCVEGAQQVQCINALKMDLWSLIKISVSAVVIANSAARMARHSMMKRKN